MTADERNTWAARLADLVLRAGRDSDKHAVLEYLALIPGESTATFLRAIARGEKPYVYNPPCDEITVDIEEPGLRYAAALLLAKRGDTGAKEILQSLAALHPFGPDQAALEVAAALTDASLPLKPAYFKYHSRALGLAALSALEWRQGSAVSADVLGAACGHFLDDVASRAEKIARHYELQRADDGTDDNELAIDYDPLLATSYPRLAVQEYSALIPKVRGLTQARLLALRAQAYTGLEEFAAAESDYANVAKTPFVEGTDVRTRLAWVQWYLGKFDDAEQTIDDALQAEPNAELVLLRGIMHYGQEDFRRSTEADLIAARVLDPKEGYAALFQHLVSALGGHPEQSQLKAYLAATPDLADWPRQITGFLLGYIDAQHLIEIAQSSDPNEVAWHTCEATFYASQAARIASRPDEERKYLEQCVATDQPNVAEFWVAKFRLEKLRPSRALPPVKSRSSGAPAI
jgi:lipoprotein NlpI